MKKRVFWVLLFVCVFLIKYEVTFASRIELLHRHSPLLNARPKTQLERIKDLLENDLSRQNMRMKRRSACESNSNSSDIQIQMPLRAGRDSGTGQYFVQFKLGTPPQKFILIADTSTELTWVNCLYRRCGPSCANNNTSHRNFFRADLSSSFKTVPCLSQTCKVDLSDLFSLTRCARPSNPCAYDYRYLDGSSSLGIFANETITLNLTNGKRMKLENVLVGCSNSFQGRSFEHADGVLGLAYNKYSFAEKASARTHGKFSYCLVDHLSHKNVSNYLTFGESDSETTLSGHLRYTKLELGLISSFYSVNVRGISIGWKMLEIPPLVWDAKSGGGMIVDSGTSLTFLADQAYQPVMAVLQKSLSKYERVQLDEIPMEFCFNSTGFDKSSVPKLVFHFTDGARFEPFKQSYVIDVADGIKCLGFLSQTWPGLSSIGNIMQQNHLWEFDLKKSKLGFAPSTCT